MNMPEVLSREAFLKFAGDLGDVRFIVCAEEEIIETAHGNVAAL
jgi:hypothetical protein